MSSNGKDAKLTPYDLLVGILYTIGSKQGKINFNYENLERFFGEQRDVCDLIRSGCGIEDINAGIMIAHQTVRAGEMVKGDELNMNELREAYQGRPSRRLTILKKGRLDKLAEDFSLSCAE